MAKGKAKSGDGIEGETIVVTHHVKEWQPNSHDSLPKIEATIDSWGRGGSSGTGLASPELATSARDLDHKEVAAQVDKITKRVKGTRKVVVTETVTEWVEGPMGSGPTAVEDESTTAGSGGDAAWAAKQFEPKEGKKGKPKRGFSFSLFGRKDKANGANGKDATAGGKADKDYQPQCMALTEDGQQCRNSSRSGSKYCISHFGYQPPTAKGLAQRIEGDAWDPDDHVTDHESVRAKDTRPAVRKAPDTRLRTRKARKGKKKR